MRTLTPLARQIQDYFDLKVPDKDIIKYLDILPEVLYATEFNYKLKRQITFPKQKVVEPPKNKFYIPPKRDKLAEIKFYVGQRLRDGEIAKTTGIGVGTVRKYRLKNKLRYPKIEIYKYNN